MLLQTLMASLFLLSGGGKLGVFGEVFRAIVEGVHDQGREGRGRCFVEMLKIGRCSVLMLVDPQDSSVLIFSNLKFLSQYDDAFCGEKLVSFVRT
jgi:hypothetical protein